MVAATGWALAYIAALALAPPAFEATAPAAGDDPRPAAALAACAAGDVRQGIAILAQLYTETRAPAFVFNQGRCYQQNGQLGTARQRFTEYLRVARNEPAADLQRARQFVGEIDDALAREKAAAPNGGGEAGARVSRVAAAALAVVAAAAVGTGVFMGMKVRSTQQDIERQFSGSSAYVTDPGTLKHEIADGTRYETWQWVSYGVGVAALAGAVTLFVLGGREAAGTATPMPTPTPTPTVVLLPAVSGAGAGGVLRVSF